MLHGVLTPEFTAAEVLIRIAGAPVPGINGASPRVAPGILQGKTNPPDLANRASKYSIWIPVCYGHLNFLTKDRAGVPLAYRCEPCGVHINILGTRGALKHNIGDMLQLNGAAVSTECKTVSAVRIPKEVLYQRDQLRGGVQ